MTSVFLTATPKEAVIDNFSYWVSLWPWPDGWKSRTVLWNKKFVTAIFFHVCVCICVCVWERERERQHARVCVCDLVAMAMKTIDSVICNPFKSTDVAWHRLLHDILREAVNFQFNQTSRPCQARGRHQHSQNAATSRGELCAVNWNNKTGGRTHVHATADFGLTWRPLLVTETAQTHAVIEVLVREVATLMS